MGEFYNFFRAELLNQFGDWAVAYSLVLVRVMSFIHAAPIFSHKSVTGLTKIGISIFLTLLMADSVDYQTPPAEGFYLPYAILLNVVLGLLMGFVVNLMFHTVVAGGEMMDSSMGFSSGQMFDPATGHQTTIVGRFFGVVSIVIFFAVQGPERLIMGLHRSFQSFDLFAPNLTMDVFKLITLCGDVIRMGFVIVSPIVLTILVADLVLGLVSRAAPQINAFQISFTIKPSIGSIVLLLTLPLFFSTLMNFFSSTSRWF